MKNSSCFFNSSIVSVRLQFYCCNCWHCFFMESSDRLHIWSYMSLVGYFFLSLVYGQPSSTSELVLWLR